MYNSYYIVCSNELALAVRLGPFGLDVTIDVQNEPDLRVALSKSDIAREINSLTLSVIALSGFYLIDYFLLLINAELHAHCCMVCI